MLHLENIHKRYGAAWAVQDVSLAVPAGGVVALVGSSGSGKSTLLRIANGLVAPDSGLVRVAGEPLGPDNLLALRRRMGYVIQEGGLFPHMTAARNVTLLARQIGSRGGWDEGRIANRLRVLSELTGLDQALLARIPGQLSGGQRQRVALMRALFLEPPLLLLDEPLGALDALTRHGLQRDLRRIFRATGVAVLLVTHDLAEAAWFSQDLLLLHRGRVAQQGSLQQLLDSPADDFVRRFVAAQRATQAAWDNLEQGVAG